MSGKGVFIVLFMFISTLIFSEQSLRLYLDADKTGTKESGNSIEQGIRLALSEIDYSIKGISIELLIRDHHGSSRRSRLHLEEFLDDSEGLAVFGGLHSPPLLANLDYINKNQILILDPWAAAGPITRSMDDTGRNWIFRLSVDDTHAGEIITRQAIDNEGFRKPALLLEDTGWGRSNNSTMISSLAARGITPADLIWFHWNIGENGAREILSDIYNSGADVIFLVANAPEGITFFRAMSERNSIERLPIRSHWGITGGNIFDQLGPQMLVDEIDLQFIQTSFSFLNKNQTVFAADVFNRASSMFSGIDRKEDIQAPCGFIHAYDLTRILISALEQMNISENARENRENLRITLENLNEPVEGLIKIYTKPFEKYSPDIKSAHEALSIEDLRMAQFTINNGIKLMEN